MLRLWLYRVLGAWLILGGVSCQAAVPNTLPQASPSDAKPQRILHLVLRGESLDLFKELVEVAQESGYTAIQFMLTEGVALERTPWQPKANAWSKAQLLEWVSFVRSRGLEVIPEIKLLSHQEKFLAAAYPQLLYNAATYDPRQEAVYALVLPLLDEIIESIRPKAIHIGHDEVVGWTPAQIRTQLKPGEQPLPADLFVQDVQRLHTHLRQKGVEVWMWGDMLLSPDEFPMMLAQHLHGRMPGYGKALRDRLPRDLVICDWHYSDEQTDFPSLTRLQAEGFRVIATTWKNEATIRNFTRYARRHNAYGIMATTWYSPASPEYGALVRWIIQTSGRVFQEELGK